MAKGYDEHPQQVLAAFSRHVERLPEGKAELRNWAKRYFELLWRWGEAVHSRPALEERLREIASLHCCERVSCLITRVRAGLTKACRELRPYVRGQHKIKFPSALARLDRNKVQYVRVSDDDALLRIAERVEDHERFWATVCFCEDCPQLAASIQWLEDVAFRTLRDIYRPVGSSLLPAFEASAQAAYEAKLELERLLCQGRQSELWRAANFLLWSYYAHNPMPDPALGWDLARLSPSCGELDGGVGRACEG